MFTNALLLNIARRDHRRVHCCRLNLQSVLAPTKKSGMHVSHLHMEKYLAAVLKAHRASQAEEPLFLGPAREVRQR
jgi:hypothetical protein